MRYSKFQIKVKWLYIPAVILLSLCILTAVLGMFDTFAWQKGFDEVINNTQAGGLNVEIREDDFRAGAGITAGSEYGGTGNRKKIDIVNSGSLPGVVRIMVLPVIREAGGGNDLLLDMTPLTFVNRNTAWTNGGDGYWYYTKVLAPGETVNFCENIKLESVSDDYEGFILNIDVLSEAKYITNNGTYPHEKAWWGSAANTTNGINTTLRTAIDTYIAANPWS